MSGDTRERLLAGAIATLRDKGIAGASARSIAAAAGVNQALVFYHFGSVDELIIAACQSATQARVALYSDQFAEVSSLRELLTVGRSLHEVERAAGNTQVLAQVLAGAQQNAILAEAAKQALNLWISEIEQTLTRILSDSPIKAALDIPGLARALAAAFIGLESRSLLRSQRLHRRGEVRRRWRARSRGRPARSDGGLRNTLPGRLPPHRPSALTRPC